MRKNKYIFFKSVSLVVLCSFYTIAGINHLIHPKTYLDLIPPYFPYHFVINILSAIVEITAGVLMLIPFTRKMAVYLIIAMLVLFIPAHIYMIQKHGCVSKYLCIAEWIAWARLPFQFILMWWAWKTYKWNS